MFGEMRRKLQALPEEICLDILRERTHGVLAVLDEEGYPYAVPLSYAYVDGKLIFHGATAGRKVDAIRHHDKATFCVVDKDDIVPEEYTTYYRSVIAFGTIRMVDDEATKRKYIEIIGKKYSPKEPDSHLQETIQNSWKALGIMELTVSHMSGKEGRMLAKQRRTLGQKEK